MDEKFKKIFDLVKKNDEFDLFVGSDIHMNSVSPYGISTSIAEMDLYLGRRGGLPAGKIVEYFGKEMVGKTTAALQAASAYQAKNGLVIFIDTENSYSPGRARELEIDPDNLFKHEANTIEEVFKILHNYLGEIDITSKRKSKKGILEDLDCPVLFIIDSICGVPTAADAQGDIDESDRPGFEAKQIKRGVRKINPLLSDLKCKPTIIFINHSFDKIGGWGQQTVSGGGRGIKYFASVRVEFSHISQLKNTNTGERLGQKIGVNIRKLKGSNLEFPTFTLDLTNQYGFDRVESLKLAMIATNFSSRPKNSRTLTILPGTKEEEQIAQTDFRRWTEQKGGFWSCYNKWRKWCIKEGYLSPWGAKDS